MVQNVGCLKENTYLCNRKSEMNALLAQLVMVWLMRDRR